MEDCAPVRDKSAECMSQSHKTDIPIEGPDTSIQVAELVVAKPANPSEVEADLGEEMVTRRTLTSYRFLPSTRLAAQPQKAPGKEQIPPPPSGHAKKETTSRRSTSRGSW